MKTRYVKIVLCMVAALMLFSCSTAGDVKVLESQRFPLRVGITPDYPPVIFKQGRKIVGIEADLARLLGERIGRPVQFKELPWDKQIPALLAREIDIIMSGMTMTKIRSLRINFTDFYLKSGLLATTRTEDSQKYSSHDRIKRSIVNIGVIPGTTGDVFVQRNYPEATRIALSIPGNAPDALIKRRSIDIFIHDAPSIMWLVSENEADLTSTWEPLNEEYLAWGIRRDDGLLLMNINGALKDWKGDGTLEDVLLKWLPPEYLERFN